MKYFNHLMACTFVEEKKGYKISLRGEYGKSAYEDCYVWQDLFVSPGFYSWAYKFYDFDIVSLFDSPYAGVSVLDDVDKIEYFKLILKFLKPNLKIEYIQDLKKYWKKKRTKAAKELLDKITELEDSLSTPTLSK